MVPTSSLRLPATAARLSNITKGFSSRSEAAARPSRLFPFNQASKQDVEALVDYIYANLGMDLDYIIPFAGIPENGREIDGLDDRSEVGSSHDVSQPSAYSWCREDQEKPVAIS